METRAATDKLQRGLSAQSGSQLLPCIWFEVSVASLADPFSAWSPPSPLPPSKAEPSGRRYRTTPCRRRRAGYPEFQPERFYLALRLWEKPKAAAGRHNPPNHSGQDSGWGSAERVTD